jgi:hypothetical protein
MHLFAEPTFCDNDWIERSLEALKQFIDWRGENLILEFDIVDDWKQLVLLYETSTANDYEWIEGAVTYV